MKRFFNVCFVSVVAGLILAACTSVPSTVSEINRMRHDEPILPEIPYEAYTVVGRVSGESTVSNVRTSTGLFEGDTGYYGSLDKFDAIYLNIGEKTAIAPQTPFDAALANAVYKMIERADELQADAVIFVRTKTKIVSENEKQAVSVQIRGIAVKLK